MGCSASLPSGDPGNERLNSVSSAPLTHTNGIMDMGYSTSLPSRNPINESANTTLSPPPTNINGHIEEERSPSPLLQQPVDAEKISNVPTHPLDIEKQQENEETSDLEKPVDAFGWLDEKKHEERELTDKEIQRWSFSAFQYSNNKYSSHSRFRKCRGEMESSFVEAILDNL